MKYDEEGNEIPCCTNCKNYRPILRRCFIYTGFVVVRECVYCRNHEWV